MSEPGPPCGHGGANAACGLCRRWNYHTGYRELWGGDAKDVRPAPAGIRLPSQARTAASQISPPSCQPCRWEGPVVTSCTLRCRSAAELGHVRRCDFDWQDGGPELCVRGNGGDRAKARSCTGCAAHEPAAP